MPGSSFKAMDLFGSGPQRFSCGKQGELTLPGYLSGGSGSGTTLLGLLELDVVVVGRLAATTEAGLWILRDAIAAQLTDPPTMGSLTDAHGRVFTDMSLVWYQEQDRVDRGRVWSVGYKALFRRLK